MNVETAQHVAGIVLQTMPFQDHHQIITLFSAEWGLMRIIIKYAYAKKKPCSVEPLNLVEVCLKESKSDLFQAISVSRLDTYLQLRSNYAVLSSSLDLLASILKSQVYHKASPILFSLLLRYLEYLPQAKFPENLRASFKLKILRLDGWLAITETCSECQNSPTSASQGQFYCPKHSPSYSFAFATEEFLKLQNLALGLSFATIDQDFLSLELEEKVNSLFAEAIGK